MRWFKPFCVVLPVLTVLAGCSNPLDRQADLSIEGLRAATTEELQQEVSTRGATATLQSLEQGELNTRPLRRWDGRSPVFDGKALGRANTFGYDVDIAGRSAKFAFLVQVQRTSGFVIEQKLVLACSCVRLTTTTTTPALHSTSCPPLRESDHFEVR